MTNLDQKRGGKAFGGSAAMTFSRSAVCPAQVKFVQT